MRKRLLGLALLACVVAAGGAAALWLTAPPPHNINMESYRRIEPGMTEEEVEALLGGPAADYSSGPIVAALAPEVIPKVLPAGMSKDDFAGLVLVKDRAFWSLWDPAKEWASDGGVILVWFNEEGRVWERRFLEVRRRHESPLDRLRRWLRW